MDNIITILKMRKWRINSLSMITQPINGTAGIQAKALISNSSSHHYTILPPWTLCSKLLESAVTYPVLKPNWDDRCT